MYGIMYGMHKTTIYLPHVMKQTLARAAASRGVSEAELIREALSAHILLTTRPSPRLPLFKSGHSRLAERVDKALIGFGEA
jgi:hypothetical protein